MANSHFICSSHAKLENTFDMIKPMLCMSDH